MQPQFLRHEHLNAAATLLERVNLAGGVANIGRYLRWQPDGVWGVLEDGALRGMVSLLRYEHVGFVGCMAVDPELQGRGLGRMLLEHAHAAGRHAGITTFLLEATPIGEHLYRKVGYVADYRSMIYGRTGIRLVEASSLRGDRDAILALDRLATGSSRDTMIRGLVDDYTGATAHARGELAGYGLIVGERLGPVIARDPGAGRAIVEQLAGGCATAATPDDNAPAVAALVANGFVAQRPITRMRLGPEVPIRVPWIWTLASAGAG